MGASRLTDASAEAQFRRAWAETTHRLAPYSAQGLDIVSPLDSDENMEVEAITNRLSSFFDFSRSTVLRPKFPGCGYVDASEGDVIFGSTLYEVKTVDRSVRSGDIRQTITYAALNAASTSNRFDIRGIGLFNPRRDQFFDIEIEQVCSEISGRSSQELFDVIIEAVSSGGIFR